MIWPLKFVWVTWYCTVDFISEQILDDVLLSFRNYLQPRVTGRYNVQYFVQVILGNKVKLFSFTLERRR